jgi:hypothetical protein
VAGRDRVMSWVDALVLRKEEKIVGTWEGIREIMEEIFQVQPYKENKEPKKIAVVKERKEGLLVLTNQRLLFLEREEPEDKHMEEAVRLALIDVDKLWFEKAPMKTAEHVAGFETHIFILKNTI